MAIGALKAVWNMISKTFGGIKVFRVKPKVDATPKGWRNEGAYETKEKAEAAAARANRAEETLKAETKATDAERAKVEAEAKLNRAKDDLGRAERGESPRSEKASKAETSESEAPKGTDRRAADPEPEAAATGRGGDRRRAADPEPAKPEAAKPEAAPKPTRGERRKQKLRDRAEIKSLKQDLKKGFFKKWKGRIVVGAGLYGGWHLATSSIEWAKENPKEYQKLLAALSDYKHTPIAVETALKAAPKIGKRVVSGMMENVEDAVTGVKGYIGGASTIMDEGIPVKTDAAKVPDAKADAKPAPKVAGAPEVAKPAPENKPPAPSQEPTTVVTGIPSSIIVEAPPM